MSEHEIASHVTWLKLKYATEPNRYALAMWKAPIEASLRLDALNCFVIPEFQEVAKAIVEKFNKRQSTCPGYIPVKKLNEIRRDLIIYDDMSPMADAVDALETAVVAQEVMQQLLLAVLEAFGTGMSSSDIVRLTVNTLLREKQNPGSCAKRMTLEEYRKFFEHVPTEKDIHTLGLNSENLQAVRDLL